jgi:restriction endonuclease S subunit
MMVGFTPTRFLDVCSVYQPEALARKDMDPNGPYPVYGANGQIGRHTVFNHEHSEIVLGCRGSVGEVHVTEPKSWITSNAMVVKPDTSRLDQSFLLHVLRTLDLRPAIGGTAQPQITRTSLSNISFPLPPFPEQQRIAAILDEAFEGISKATLNAERNLANARELFERNVTIAFEAGRAKWKPRTLAQVCVVERGSSPRPIKQFLTEAPDGVNWIKIGDTQEGARYVTTTKEKITPFGALRSRRVLPGDFILTNSMSFGRPYIMGIEGCIHDGWFVLRLNKDINPDYFYFLLSSRFVQNQFRMLATGSVVLNISSDLVKRVVFPMPPLAEQIKITESFTRFTVDTEALQNTYESKLRCLRELKRSILHKAFSGQITYKKAVAA